MGISRARHEAGRITPKALYVDGEFQCSWDSDYICQWLQENKKFYYEGSNGHFTAHKDSRNYWTASRRVSGKLRKKRLGVSCKINAQKLEDAALFLAVNIPKGVYTNSDARAKIAKLQVELQRANTRIYELEKQLAEK